MNTFYRILLQILFWVMVWVIIGLNQEHFFRFLWGNWIAFVFQVVLLSSLVYILAPKLLLKKKYVFFILLSVGIVFIFAFISSEFIVPQKPPHLRIPKGPKPPSAFFIHFLLLSLAFVLATVIEIFLYAQKKEEEIISSKNENLKTELKLLKSQINPHFLFNTLNNIYALSVIDSEKTQQSISYLSDMLRYVLYECERSFVSLQKEVNYIENYIKLFSIKSSKNHRIETEFNIINPNVSIAPMLLIPFVENAFKHSNIERTEDSFIKISLNTTSVDIYFKIENTTPTYMINKDNVGGIGIENVKKRLSILYSEKHTLAISEMDKIFKVELKLQNNV